MRRAGIPALAAIVGLSFVARTVLAWLRASPLLFPDEYTYAALGRSLAESGRPLIRGASPHFPALLQPIVTAPAWLVGDVDVGYRLVQTIGALAMSLAAVPVFLLARRVGVSTRLALGVAALSVLVPDLVYSSFVSSEGIAYPLVLGAAYAAVRAIVRPTRRAQIAFVAFAALATFARIQFVVLPVVFLAAAALVGLRERRVKAALREQVLPVVLFAVPALALVAVGPGRALGPYRAILGFHSDPGEVARWASLDAMTLAYTTGWIVVPGALLGLWLSLSRPRGRDELAFAATIVLLALALLPEAGVLQATVPTSSGIQERYVFYLAPLVALSFALYAARGWPLRLTHLALAAALVLVSVRLPLSAYAIPSSIDGSPILFGVYWLSTRLGESGTASLVVAAAVGVLSAVVVLASRRPRLGTPLALGLAIVATAAASAGAVVFDVANTGRAKRAYLPQNPSWIDDARVGGADLLQAWGGIKTASLAELFWNRSIDRVLLLPGASPIDRFGDDEVRVGDDGSLSVGGKPLARPLVVDGFGSSVQLRGARLAAKGPTAALWIPDGKARLSLYEIGRYHDRWLAKLGAVYLWPASPGGRLSGVLSQRLTATESVGPVTLRWQGPQETVYVKLRPGETRTVSLRVCSRGAWYATYHADTGAFAGGLRLVSVRAAAPEFQPSAAACAS